MFNEEFIVDEQIETQTFPIRMRSRGQITLPREIRDDLEIDEGDTLYLVQIEDMLFLTPKRLRVTELAEKIAASMEEQGVTLADMLQDLEEIREENWRKRQQ